MTKKEVPAVWTADFEKGGSILSEAVYKLYLESAVSSISPTKTYGTFTTSSSASWPSSSGTFLPGLRRNMEIGDEEMQQLVDKLVKERYPAYVPRR